MSYTVFCSKSSKINMYSMLIAHRNSDTKFSWETLDLYLDVIKFTAEEVDSVYGHATLNKSNLV